MEISTRTVWRLWLVVLGFSFLFSSCSTNRYAHLNKVNRERFFSKDKIPAVLDSSVQTNEDEETEPVEADPEIDIENIGMAPAPTSTEVFAAAEKAHPVAMNKPLYVAKHVEDRVSTSTENKHSLRSRISNTIAKVIVGKKEMKALSINKRTLWTIIIVLLVLYVLGLLGNAGALIHLLLIIALILLILNLLNYR